MGCLFVLLLGLVVVFAPSYLFHRTTTEIMTLCSVESVAKQSGSTTKNEYRVTAVDAQGETRTLVIKDSHWPTTWRTRSADTVGDLRRQMPGSFRVVRFGWRNGLLSLFPNIQSATRVGPVAPGTCAQA
jgi:hypothetical protein